MTTTKREIHYRVTDKGEGFMVTVPFPTDLPGLVDLCGVDVVFYLAVTTAHSQAQALCRVKRKGNGSTDPISNSNLQAYFDEHGFRPVKGHVRLTDAEKAIREARRAQEMALKAGMTKEQLLAALA